MPESFFTQPFLCVSRFYGLPTDVHHALTEAEAVSMLAIWYATLVFVWLGWRAFACVADWKNRFLAFRRALYSPRKSQKNGFGQHDADFVGPFGGRRPVFKVF